MNGKTKQFRWFLAEIPELVEKEIITPDTASALEKYYLSQAGNAFSPQKTFSLILGIIGLVMVAAGSILFLNYNWDMFPKGVRIALAALPLAAGAGVSYFTIAAGKGQLWRETSAVLTAAGTGTLIAVLSQIYHTGGELNEFMFLLLLLSLPLICIFNSVGLASLYTALSFMVTGHYIPPWWSGLLMLLFLPWLLFHLREKSPWKVWCRYLAMAGCLYLMVNCCVKGPYDFFPAMLLCSILAVGGMDLLKENGSFLKNPWLIPAFAVQTILLAAGSCTQSMFRVTPERGEWSYWTVCALLSLIFLCVFLKKRITLERSLSLLLVVLSAIPLFCKEPVMQIVCNCYLGVAGISFMRKGIKSSSLLIFNGGAVMICILTGCRFFDSDIGVLYRSAGLVLLGIGFMAANGLFIKFYKGAEK